LHIAPAKETGITNTKQALGRSATVLMHSTGWMDPIAGK